MNETQKNKATAAHSKLTAWLTGLGVPANWAKVGAGILIGATIGALSTCQQSCTTITPSQVIELHDLYHDLSGDTCILIPANCEK